MRKFLGICAISLSVLLIGVATQAAVAPESFNESDGQEQNQAGPSVGTTGGTPNVDDNLKLNIGAVLDGVQTVHTDPADNESNNFELRSFEMNVGGAVDPHFDGFATFAFHDGVIELEEGYVITTLPQKFSGAKLVFGKEKLELGYLNRFHGHDFPQLDAPVAFEKLLGAEGVRLEGAHLSWLRPASETLALGLQTGFYNGFPEDEEDDGHDHSGLGDQFADGQRPYHVRGTLFYESPNMTHGFLLGTSYLDVLDNEVRNEVGSDSSAGFTVVDAKYRYRPAGESSQLILAGEWYRNEGIPESAPAGSSRTEDFTGFYGYTQYDLDRYWGFGYRYGQSEHLNNDNEVQNNTVYGVYRPSEFSRLRLQAKQNTHPKQPDETILGFQGTVFLGWHPAHRF